ncbi:hypothetical protein DRE_04468 [Drechslerella stenobrocha 248]|uniref:Uncharacterized protein n=1 Tax=Drechslerella stenobrocha 248 TaxID=1043628 RepID=W7I1A0_9PEZI|nr:hypothetical protein DRE_04468 [Drechslerella stenobrocha 248]
MKTSTFLIAPLLISVSSASVLGSLFQRSDVKARDVEDLDEPIYSILKRSKIVSPHDTLTAVTDIATETSKVAPSKETGIKKDDKELGKDKGKGKEDAKAKIPPGKDLGKEKPQRGRGRGKGKLGRGRGRKGRNGGGNRNATTTIDEREETETAAATEAYLGDEEYETFTLGEEELHTPTELAAYETALATTTEHITSYETVAVTSYAGLENPGAAPYVYKVTITHVSTVLAPVRHKTDRAIERLHTPPAPAPYYAAAANPATVTITKKEQVGAITRTITKQVTETKKEVVTKTETKKEVVTKTETKREVVTETKREVVTKPVEKVVTETKREVVTKTETKRVTETKKEVVTKTETKTVHVGAAATVTEHIGAVTVTVATCTDLAAARPTESEFNREGSGFDETTTAEETAGVAHHTSTFIEEGAEPTATETETDTATETAAPTETGLEAATTTESAAPEETGKDIKDDKKDDKDDKKDNKGEDKKDLKNEGKNRKDDDKKDNKKDNKDDDKKGKPDAKDDKKEEGRPDGKQRGQPEPRPIFNAHPTTLATVVRGARPTPPTYYV